MYLPKKSGTGPVYCLKICCSTFVVQQVALTCLLAMLFVGYVRNALRQNLLAPAGTFSCSRARCYTCSFLNSACTSISGPKSNFVIRHNFTCTSSNIIYCISCSKCCKLYIDETGRRLSDRFAEHLRSVRNNDVDKPVARHVNAANHSISDIKVCAISPISGCNYSRKRHEKRLIFKIGTIHPHGLNEPISFIWLYPFFSWLLTFSLHCLYSSTTHLFISRLRLVYWSTLKIANYLPIFASYFDLLLSLSREWLTFCHMITLFYKNLI